MAGPAHPDAMAPSKPGPTRTAPPQMPASWWSHPRIRTYLLFDATGIVYLLLGLVALRVVWALGAGPEVFEATIASLSHPLYIGFHLLGLVSVIFVGVRFFRFFPKSQPPRIGPVKPPPQPVILAGLYAAWIGLTLGIAFILAGGIF
jgi:fumarate reductase subunit C